MSRFSVVVAVRGSTCQKIPSMIPILQSSVRKSLLQSIQHWDMRLLVGVVDGWVGYQYRNAHLSSLGEGYSTPSLNESLNPFVPNQGPFPSLDRDIDIKVNVLDEKKIEELYTKM